MRPARLASDTASTVSVVLHALAWLKKKERWVPDVTVVVQPTSPLVQGKDVDAAVRTLSASRANSCISVTAARERPEWMFALAKGKLRKPYPSDLAKRSQDLPHLYQINGAVYATRTPFILKKKKLFDVFNLIPHIMPPSRSIDIDHRSNLAAARRAL
jgi:CMP-N-acetylneuraminic acid synthetase